MANCNVCESIKDSKIHVKDLSLLEHELLKLRTKRLQILILRRKIFANINLTLSFSIIIGDMQLILKVIEML